MPDPFTALATKLIAAVLNDTDEPGIAAILREALTPLYLTASAAGGAGERERVTRLVHALVDNAAGDTSLGQTILKKIEGR